MTNPSIESVGVRDRGLALPSHEEIERCAFSSTQERTLAAALITLKNSLYSEWLRFAQGHYSGIPTVEESGADDWSEFTGAYSQYLRRFKRARRSDDRVNRYAVSIRTKAYDEVFSVWSDIGRLYRQSLAADVTLDEFGDLSFRVGWVCRVLHMFAEDQLNAAEYLIADEQLRGSGGQKGSKVDIQGARMKGNAARRELYARAQRFVENQWENDGAFYKWKKRPKHIVQSYIKMVAQVCSTRDGAPLTVTEDTVKSWMALRSEG